ncbi:OX-2 membrane glycoprotein-like [Gopherus flavomarginatus]|uniref:OX-2 membrane glycoprotein-like n=1 Tax=Gopherus flavomarginatus TaxID=286002 RepID=UPI0021CBEAD6|nr:OX-2 membrane glycoprotein-like [Gopherus flavomarginatus]
MMFTCIFFSWIWAMAAGSLQVVHRKVQSSKTGEKVTFHCQLVMDHEVLQVTWQKENGEGKGNIATYSRINGRRILDNYSSRVNFTQSELTVSAITVHAVTLQDEGCYRCIFNTFPMGSITGRTCLKVYAISEPSLEAKLVSSPENGEEKMLEISCSVTGKPAPMISWNLSHHLQEEPGQYLINHSDQTVTVISNFTHVPSRIHWENLAGCVIQHPLLNVTLTLSKDGQVQGQSAAVNTVTIYVLVALIPLGLLCICFCILFICWKRHHQMDRNKADLCWVLPICTKDMRHGQCTKNDKQGPDKLPPLKALSDK